jgi:hypothetical protein
VPLILRIVTLPFAVLGILVCYLSIHDGGAKLAHGNPLVAFALAALLVLVFVQLWFWRVWILWDGEQGVLVRKHRGLFGVSRKLTQVRDIAQVYVRRVSIRATVSWDVGLTLVSGQRQWLTRIHDEQAARQLASALCDAMAKPQAPDPSGSSRKPA